MCWSALCNQMERRMKLKKTKLRLKTSMPITMNAQKIKNNSTFRQKNKCVLPVCNWLFIFYLIRLV